MVFGSLMGRQTIPIPIGIVVSLLTNDHNVNVKTVKLFRPYKFDSSDAIIGIDFSDSANTRYGKYNFIIDNANDLSELQKSWVFKKYAQPESGQGVFKVYYIRNKVIKNRWNVFPESKSIVTDEGFYLFDTSMLSTLHSKSPLVYSTRTDTVKSKNEFIRFTDSIKANAGFLFLIEPGMLYEGSFDVTIKAGSRYPPEEVGERIINICDKIKPKTAFKVFLKEDDKASDAKYKTYVVKCNQSLFEHFSDPATEKGDWTTATYVIQSFWRE
jgi:hypothetical protein